MARNELGNVILEEGFEQVCVWPGTLVGEDRIEEFKKFFIDEFSTRVQYLEEILTAPDTDKRGNTVPGTGGRCDAFFAVHSDDIAHFAVPRLSLGIRWIEDVYLNGGGGLYEDRVASYKTW